jgi:hypothetical protein
LILTRISIMALIDASSFPAINFQYLGPAIVLLPLAITSSIYASIPSIIALRRPGRGLNITSSSA